MSNRQRASSSQNGAVETRASRRPRDSITNSLSLVKPAGRMWGDGISVVMRRTIRRPQLRQLVPLSDTTIYEMEEKSEFPRRFYLTARCVVWDLAEVEAWIEERRRASDASLIKRAPSPDVRLRKTRPVRQ
jgi:prophage regulatory protein